MRHFAFSLARELGMTVRQLLSSMDAVELVEWMMFFKIERDSRESAKTPKLSSQVLSEKLKMALMGRGKA